VNEEGWGEARWEHAACAWAKQRAGGARTRHCTQHAAVLSEGGGEKGTRGLGTSVERQPLAARRHYQSGLGQSRRRLHARRDPVSAHRRLRSGCHTTVISLKGA
jgi:50S ribosomal subunit-associated GTPase HflX